MMILRVYLEVKNKSALRIQMYLHRIFMYIILSLCKRIEGAYTLMYILQYRMEAFIVTT
jgi:hypothetical protein